MTRYCLLVGATGLALLLAGAGFVGSTGWGKDLFAPGAALMTVALTGYIAARGVVTWAEQRGRDRETSEYKHREEVYEKLASYMLGRFLYQLRTGTDEEKAEARKAGLLLDAELRTKAALWGSASTVATLAHWQTILSMVLDNHNLPGGGQTDTTEVESKFLKDALGEALMSMRADLAPATGQAQVSKAIILKSIFND